MSDPPCYTKLKNHETACRNAATASPRAWSLELGPSLGLVIWSLELPAGSIRTNPDKNPPPYHRHRSTSTTSSRTLYNVSGATPSPGDELRDSVQVRRG